MPKIISQNCQKLFPFSAKNYFQKCQNLFLKSAKTYFFKVLPWLWERSSDVNYFQTHQSLKRRLSSMRWWRETLCRCRWVDRLHQSTSPPQQWSPPSKNRKKSLGFGSGDFGLGKKVLVSVSENLVSEKKSRFWFWKIWSQKRKNQSNKKESRPSKQCKSLIWILIFVCFVPIYL